MRVECLVLVLIWLRHLVRGVHSLWTRCLCGDFHAKTQRSKDANGPSRDSSLRLRLFASFRKTRFWILVSQRTSLTVATGFQTAPKAWVLALVKETFMIIVP